MLKLCALVAASATIIAGAAIVGHSQKVVKDNVHNRMVTIKGHVESLNYPDEPGVSGIDLVFQRVGCRDCLVATYSNENGDYSIRVGRGRYKLVVYDASRPGYDIISPSQARYINAIPRLQDTVFNIKVVVPESR